MESEVRGRMSDSWPRREGRWDDKFACFAPEATVVDGRSGPGSLDEYRSAWERWAAGQQDGSRVLSVETLVMKLHMLGDVAVLVHSIHICNSEQTKGRRQLTNERPSCSRSSPTAGGWWCISTYLRNRTESSRHSKALCAHCV